VICRLDIPGHEYADEQPLTYTNSPPPTGSFIGRSSASDLHSQTRNGNSLLRHERVTARTAARMFPISTKCFAPPDRPVLFSAIQTGARGCASRPNRLSRKITGGEFPVAWKAKISGPVLMPGLAAHPCEDIETIPGTHGNGWLHVAIQAVSVPP